MTYTELGPPPETKIADYDYWLSMYYCGLGLEQGGFTGYKLTHLNFNDTAGLTKTITLFTQAAKEYFPEIILKTATAFAGVATLVADVGISGNATKYVNSYNLKTAVSNTNILRLPNDLLPTSFTGTTAIQLKLTATVQNLDQLSAGELHIWVPKRVYPTPVQWSA